MIKAVMWVILSLPQLVFPKLFTNLQCIGRGAGFIIMIYITVSASFAGIQVIRGPVICKIISQIYKLLGNVAGAIKRRPVVDVMSKSDITILTYNIICYR